MKPKAPGEDDLVEDSEDEDEGFLDSTFDRDCYSVKFTRLNLLRM